jgi:hypothetical protein
VYLNGCKLRMSDQNSLILMTKMVAGDGHGVPHQNTMLFDVEGGPICHVLLHEAGAK